MGDLGPQISHQASHSLPAVFAVERAGASQGAMATLSVCAGGTWLTLCRLLLDTLPWHFGLGEETEKKLAL